MSDQQELRAPENRERFPQKWRVLVSVIFGIFMVILDTTVVNVAFQTLRNEFGATLNDSQWIISIYVLSIGISTPLSGYLSDRFGIKRIYLSGLVIFIVGSFLCGISPNLGFMIAARAFQGFGGGIAIPLGTALLFRTFPPKEQGTALGIFGIAALTAPAVGPILGGFLVDQNLWRFIFFINPPIGLVGVILGMVFLPDLKNDRKPRFDFLGLVTEVVGFGAVLYAASIAATQGWSAGPVLFWFGVGAAGLIAFTLVELFVAKEPLLDLRLFGRSTFLIASLLGYVSVIALFGAEFLMPIYLQALRGRSALQTGLIVLPMAATGAFATSMAGRLYDQVGPRVIVGVSFVILIVNTWQLSQIQATTPIAWILFLLALRGLALGGTVQTTFVTALSVVPLRHVARGSSLVNATRQVVQSIGVAALATVLASTLSPQIASFQQQFQDAPGQAKTTPIAICEIQPGATASLSPQIPPQAVPLLQETCRENIAGFEKAYKITFYAAIVCLILGLILPGWPFKWAGRRAADAPPVPSAH